MSKILPTKTNSTTEEFLKMHHCIIAVLIGCACFTCDFFLIVIIVARGEEVSKDQCRHIHLLIFVFNNRNSLPIIPHGDDVGLSFRTRRTMQRNRIQLCFPTRYHCSYNIIYEDKIVYIDIGITT